MRTITQEFKSPEFAISVLESAKVGEPILILSEYLASVEDRQATVNVNVVNISNEPVKSLRIKKVEVNDRHTKIISTTEPQTIQPGEHASLSATVLILDNDTFHYNLDTGRAIVSKSKVAAFLQCAEPMTRRDYAGLPNWVI